MYYWTVYDHICNTDLFNEMQAINTLWALLYTSFFNHICIAKKKEKELLKIYIFFKIEALVWYFLNTGGKCLADFDNI